MRRQATRTTCGVGQRPHEPAAQRTHGARACHAACRHGAHQNVTGALTGAGAGGAVHLFSHASSCCERICAVAAVSVARELSEWFMNAGRMSARSSRHSSPSRMNSTFLPKYAEHSQCRRAVRHPGEASERGAQGQAGRTTQRTPHTAGVHQTHPDPPALPKDAECAGACSHARVRVSTRRVVQVPAGGCITGSNVIQGLGKGTQRHSESTARVLQGQVPAEASRIPPQR